MTAPKGNARPSKAPPGHQAPPAQRSGARESGPRALAKTERAMLAVPAKVVRGGFRPPETGPTESIGPRTKKKPGT